ncbi:peptidase C12 ubiquitin carboxyl-terminal hydrolase 1 [Lyophyllum atratum]|nr:peptidase C12 ubiquitin carboxyl-terminal hydrolase 1 [Lyophyllum atratum]
MSTNAPWVPLECNPEVFNGWANQAGLDPSDQFYDLYGLDSELLSAIPRPVKAVIFVFPWNEARQRRDAEDGRLAQEGGPKIDENVFWMKQTIRNACGAMAIIHGLANTDVTLIPGSPLHAFFNECRHKPIPERSKLLEDTPIFAEIHASVAAAGQSVLPLTDAHPDQAYCTFISAPGEGSTGRRVIELDGGRTGPFDHGECTDLLDDVARIVQEKFMDKNPSVLYSMLYLGSSM